MITFWRNTNYRFNSETSESRELVKVVLKVKVQAECLQNLHKTLQRDIKFISKRSAVYYDKKKDRELTLKERGKVYLLQQNIKTKWSSKKLNYIKLESFRIVKKKESFNYKLTLFSAMWIHSVFHIFILKPADLLTLIQEVATEINSESQNAEFKVKEVLKQWVRKGKLQYWVKWEEYDSSENTWELKENLIHCFWKLRAFHQ